MYSISKEEFTQLANEVFEDLPDEFHRKIENIEIFIDDWPSPEVCLNLKIRRENLLGLYTGVPIGKRSFFHTFTLPNQIYLYQKNIERICRSHQELADQIRRTLLHEIGHHFGMNDRELRSLGY